MTIRVSKSQTTALETDEMTNGECGVTMNWIFGKKSIKKGSLFQDHESARIHRLLFRAYEWLDDTPHCKMARKLELSPTTVTKWAQTYAHLLETAMLADDEQIGGPGVIVEID